MDLSAAIVVGLPWEDLELSDEEIWKLDDEYWVSRHKFLVHRPYDSADDDIVIVGYVLAETDDWTVKKIDLQDLFESSLNHYLPLFKKTFGQSPKVYLVPFFI